MSPDPDCVTLPHGTPILLLTGLPGVGKTTLIRGVVTSLGSMPAAGFYTDEIREAGGRVGFRATTLDGRTLVMAHVNFAGPARVGRYGVDLAVVEALGESILRQAPRTALVVVDEIGKMECLSSAFVRAVRTIVDGSRPLVATIGMKGVPLLDELRHRPGVTLWEVTVSNRDHLRHDLSAWVQKALGRRGDQTSRERPARA